MCEHGAMFLSDSPARIPTGYALIAAEALREGAEYGAVEASAFQWRSRDGICSIINQTAFSGGDLIQEGDEFGTVIAGEVQSVAGFTSVHLRDLVIGEG
jgi:hypothetical protein